MKSSTAALQEALRRMENAAAMTAVSVAAIALSPIKDGLKQLGEGWDGRLCKRCHE